MDQPAVTTASTTLREGLVRGESFITALKPARKTSSFEREGWWRIALTNTPIPGTYHLKTFIEESLLNPVIATYNFKNEGRKKPPLVQRNNPVLNDLPQHMPPDFLDLLKKQAATYSFKDKPRPSPSTLVDKDQFLELSATSATHSLDVFQDQEFQLYNLVTSGQPEVSLNCASQSMVPESIYNEWDREKMVMLSQPVASESLLSKKFEHSTSTGASGKCICFTIKFVFTCYHHSIHKKLLLQSKLYTNTGKTSAERNIVVNFHVPGSARSHFSFLRDNTMCFLHRFPNMLPGAVYFGQQFKDSQQPILFPKKQKSKTEKGHK
ncbi:hypothetical protein H8959_014611 [Pygathrix nigripes]